MQNILNIPKVLQKFVARHKLYANLHALVVSMVLSVILMQTGSLFLFDYIPDHMAVVQRAYQDQALWKVQLYQLDADFNNNRAVYNRLNENMNQPNEQVYSWARKQKDSQLAVAYEQLETAQHNFSAARVQGQAKARMLEQGQLVIYAYTGLVDAAKDDIVMKQSLVALLQFVCLFLVFCIGACIMLMSWSLLIRRLGKVIALMPEDLIQGKSQQLYDDEFEQLEQLTAAMCARLEGLQVETKWTNKSSKERMRKMIMAQNFLFKLAKLIGNSGLSELTIKKVLYSLEKTLGVSNVALVFNENGSSITAQRGLFSSYWPLSYDATMFDESINAHLIKHTTKLIKGECVQCVTVPLPSPNGWLGILILETEANHYFEETELELFEVTAQMLLVSMGFQAREQEGRRVALLEERAVIARELHDSLAQSLSYMKFQLARLQTNFGTHLVESGADIIVNDLREGLDNAYRELRELLSTFRVQMDIRGLDHVLIEAIEEFSQRSSLNIILDNRLQDCRLSVNEEFHLLHVVREALSNIVRHSGAKKVTIALVLQSTGDVLVTVDDDGKGCAFDETKPHHYGLVIMKERALCLGGTIEVLARRGGGTRVRLLFRPK